LGRTTKTKVQEVVDEELYEMGCREADFYWRIRCKRVYRWSKMWLHALLESHLTYL